MPALTTRKIETEVELEDGQSFAIAGLLDRQTTETLSKIPGLGDIPIIGKLFTSKTINKNNSELLVIVTPELVAAIPKDQPNPDLQMPETFLEAPGVMNEAPRTPGTDKTGPPPARPVRTEISVQEMEKIERDNQAQGQQGQGGASAGGFGTGGAGITPGSTMTIPTGPASPSQTNSNGPVQQ